ncbi:hypothetical protein GYB59_19025 [bacterium]|nr:hypothetical protein [bacterium]
MPTGLNLRVRKFGVNSIGYDFFVPRKFGDFTDVVHRQNPGLIVLGADVVFDADLLDARAGFQAQHPCCVFGGVKFNFLLDSHVHVPHITSA